MASVRGSRCLYDEFVLERIRSTLPECKSECWINYFIYAIFPCSDFVLLNFVSADSRITSGRNQKFVSLLLISSSSRPNLLCFGFDLNQSQHTIPISRSGNLPDCTIKTNIATSWKYLSTENDHIWLPPCREGTYIKNNLLKKMMDLMKAS